MKSTALKNLASSRISVKGYRQRNYHRCLSVLLQELVELQEGFDTFIRIGNKIQFRRIKLAVACVIGDGKSSECLSLMKQGIPKFVNQSCSLERRVCRLCMVPHNALDDAWHQCEFVKASDIDRIVRGINAETTSAKHKSYLQLLLSTLGAHPAQSAFADVGFGANPFGILMATCVDVMHVLELGWFPYVLEVFGNSMTNKVRSDLDKLIDRLFNMRSTAKKLYPRVNFTRGSTSLSLLTAKEWPGLALAFLIALRDPAGERITTSCFMKDDLEWDYPSVNESTYPHKIADMSRQLNPSDSFIEEWLQSQKHDPTTDIDDDNDKELESEGEGVALSPQTQKKAIPMNCSKEQFCSLLQDLLLFHRWVTSGQAFFHRVDSNQIKRNTSTQIRRLVYRMTLLCKRVEGHGWKLRKVHEIFHLVSQIDMFGVPDNFVASHGERLLKTFAKTPSRWCQLRQDRFNTQLAGQVHLMQVFHNALESAKPVHPVQPRTHMRLGCSGFRNLKSTFVLDREKGSLSWRDGTRRSCEPHPLIASRFKDHPLEQFFCCEYVDMTNHCYRAHPDFGGEGPFYDFVRIRKDDNELIPARILTFYKSNDGQDMVAVHPARRMVENHNIIQRWEMAMTISRGVFVPRIVNFPVEKIETPLLAFVEGGNNGLMETYHARVHILAVEKPELWPINF